MSARLLEFPDVGKKSAPLSKNTERGTVALAGSEAVAGRIPPEVLYRIFCSEDERMQDLAMEYFLLECD